MPRAAIAVLILIVLEFALARPWGTRQRATLGRVLILIVLEFALALLFY